MTNSETSRVLLRDILIPIKQPIEMNDDKEYVTITIKRNYGGIEEREKLKGHKIKTKKQFKLVPGSFIISRVQCWHKPFAIIPENFPKNSIASVNYDQFEFSQLIDKKYFWWLCHSSLFVKTVRNSASGVDIEKMRLDTKKWLSYEISIPTIKEQRKIASHIEQVEFLKSKILSALKNIDKNLHFIRQSFLETIFEGGLTKEEKEPKESTELGIEVSEFIKERIDELPVPWKWVQMKELIQSMKNGIYKSAEFYGKGTPCLRMYNIEEGKIVWKNVKEMILTNQEISDYGLESGDVLFNRVNSRELLGKSAVIPSGLGPIVFESKNIRIRLYKKIISPEFFAEFFKTKFARFQIECYCKQTAGMASISQSDIEKIIIPLPPINEQRQLIDKIDKISEKIIQLTVLIQSNIQKISTITDSMILNEFKINPQLLSHNLHNK